MPLEEHQSHHRDTNRQGDRVAEALGRLDEAVSAIHDSEAFRRYLDVQARFHRYSFGNVLLILSQQPEATHVAGYRTWQSLGRQVRRGERGIKILVPMRVRQRENDADVGEATDSAGQTSDDDPAGARQRLLFGIGTVFDIAQTDGEPLATIDVPVLAGDDGVALYTQLEAIASQEGLTVERGSRRLTRPQTMGFYSPTERLIVVREAAARQMTKTLAHELAHHFGGATAPSAEEETVAESVAYVVCARFGLDTGERSFPYVATWSREIQLFRHALGRIQGLSGRLIDHLERETGATRGIPTIRETT
jgi:antirestriction protein ArdC